ncbi:MAG: amidohydrolase [Lachnospiraceae bacterium]|nr:amidohydrolase [Lachnospiraceae bacterium]
MNTLFTNGKLITFAGAPEVINNAAVAVKGSSIVFAGKADDPAYKSACSEIKFDREIDLKGNLILPGFKNCHTHSGMTFLRSAADDMKLDQWLNKQIFPREALLSEDDIYFATKLAVMEYLTSGVTEICDMYLTPPSIARAVEETGMRCVQCGSLNDFSQTPELLIEWYENLNKENSLNSFRLGIHAEYTCSEELLKRVAGISHDLKAPVYMHMSETAHEVDGCRERHGGLSPVEYLDSLGLFDYGSVFFHGVHVTDNDIDIIKKRNISVVTNPASNAKLASGIAPIDRYLKEGITLGIGTDGPASNNCLDMFREMFLTTAMAKLRENDAAAVDAADVLKIACSDGAKAIGTPECDSLAPGKKADLIVIDLKQPNMQPENNIVKNLVYSGSKQNVIFTMIDGVVRYENGSFNIGEDEEKIYKEVQNIVERINREISID